MDRRDWLCSIILFLAFLFSAFTLTKYYDEVKLKEGLPQERRIPGGFGKPFHAAIKSNNLFHALYFVKDFSKDEDQYWIIYKFDSLSTSVSSGSFKIKDNIYYDSLTIKMNDENESLVHMEIFYNKESNTIKYHWLNSESSESCPGGKPKIVNPKIIIGISAPDFRVTSLDNKQIRLSSLRGKYVFIDFWGTWCGGCVMELPEIMKLRKYYSEEKLFIIGLAAYDDQNKLEKFLKEKPLNYPNALIDKTILDEYGINSFPSSLLIDKNGIVIGKNLTGEDLIEKVKFRIEKIEGKL